MFSPRAYSLFRLVDLISPTLFILCAGNCLGYFFAMHRIIESIYNDTWSSTSLTALLNFSISIYMSHHCQMIVYLLLDYTYLEHLHFLGAANLLLDISDFKKVLSHVKWECCLPQDSTDLTIVVCGPLEVTKQTYRNKAYSQQKSRRKEERREDSFLPRVAHCQREGRESPKRSDGDGKNSTESPQMQTSEKTGS